MLFRVPWREFGVGALLGLLFLPMFIAVFRLGFAFGGLDADVKALSREVRALEAEAKEAGVLDANRADAER
jgi:fumarate reductase subunit D